MKDIRPSALLGSLFGIALLTLLSSCGGGESGSGQGQGTQAADPLAPREHLRERPPVVVIGVDGMTWNVVEPLFQQDRMPNLRKLVDRGVAGNLYTDRPPYSPVLWTSIATGTKFQDHGIHYFTEATVKGRPLEGGLPYTSNSRKVPAIWNLAGEQGRTVNSVAWWVSWPAEEVPNGRIVASYAAQAQATILWKPLVMKDGLPKLTYPDALQDTIDDTLYAGRPDGPLVEDYNGQFGTVPGEWTFANKLDRFFRGVFHADRTHQRVFLQMLEEHGVADLNLVYYGLPDVAGHYFWRYRTPHNYSYYIPEAHIERLGKHIDLAYEQFDVWLGEMVAALPEDCTILLVSDHGMGPENLDNAAAIQSGGHTNAPPGVMVVAGTGVVQYGLQPRGKRTLGSIYDITPTVLDMLGLATGSYMEGQPLRHMMTEEWQAAHPALEPKDYREGYRPATRPQVPTEDANQDFLSAIEQIGYAGESSEEMFEGTGEDSEPSPDGK